MPNGIIENLIASGLEAAGVELAEVFGLSDRVARRVCRSALRNAIEATLLDLSRRQRRWVYDVLADALADGGVPSRLTGLSGTDRRDLSSDIFRERFQRALRPTLAADLHITNIDLDKLLVRFGQELVTELRKSARKPRSRLAPLVDRLEHDILSRGVTAVGFAVGAHAAGTVADRLGQMKAATVARMTTRLEALGVSSPLAVAIANELADPLAPPAPNPLAHITDEVGAGKSTTADRLHLWAIARASDSTGAPLPLHVDARSVTVSIEREFRAWWGDVADSGRGLHLVLDGMDEVGLDTAIALVGEARTLLRQYPNSAVVLASRPLPLPGDLGVAIHVPELDETSSDALIARVAGIATDDVTKYQWPASLRDAVRRPLFAIAAGLAIARGRQFATVPELMTQLAQRGIDGTRWTQLLDPLSDAAHKAIDAGLRPIRINEMAGTPANERLLVESRLVNVTDGMASFSVPLIAEWLAAQYLLQHPGFIEELVRDPVRLDKWRYCLLLVVQIAGFDHFSPVLSRLTAAAPAMGSWVVDRCRVHRFGDPTSVG